MIPLLLLLGATTRPPHLARSSSSSAWIVLGMAHPRLPHPRRGLSSSSLAPAGLSCSLWYDSPSSYYSVLLVLPVSSSTWPILILVLGADHHPPQQTFPAPRRMIHNPPTTPWGYSSSLLPPRPSSPHPQHGQSLFSSSTIKSSITPSLHHHSSRPGASVHPCENESALILSVPAVVRVVKIEHQRNAVWREP